MPSRTSAEASRAARKLAAALDAFAIDPTGCMCADLGSNAGGFVQTLLERGASRIYAIERGYGVLDYRLRRDPRVVVRERTDALSVFLPEPMDLVTIDVGWTRQERILPAAARLLGPQGRVISLIKPHYEAEASQLDGGVLRAEHRPAVLDRLRQTVRGLSMTVLAETESPLRGQAGNVEYLWLILPQQVQPCGPGRSSEPRP